MLQLIECPHAGGSHRVACRIHGEEGAPTVLCVHGLSRNGHDFDPIARRLSGRFRVVCIDMPGRGDSDWLEDPSLYSDATYLSDLRNVMRVLRLASVHWIGTSMGGVLGMRLAGTEPARFRSLVLNDIGAELDGVELERLRRAAAAEVSFATRDEALAWFRERYAAFGSLSESRWMEFTETGIERRPDGRLRPRFDVRAVPRGALPGRVDLWPVYRAIRCPTLVIRGADSALLDRATCEAMSQCGPRAGHVEIEHAGHAPDLSDERLVEAIAKFLECAQGGGAA